MVENVKIYTAGDGGHYCANSLKPLEGDFYVEFDEIIEDNCSFWFSLHGEIHGRRPKENVVNIDKFRHLVKPWGDV